MKTELRKNKVLLLADPDKEEVINSIIVLPQKKALRSATVLQVGSLVDNIKVNDRVGFKGAGTPVPYSVNDEIVTAEIVEDESVWIINS